MTSLPAFVGAAAAALSVLSAAGCADDFTPYEDIDRPRLLAIAADDSELIPGASAALSALVTATDVTYQWSWCPIAGRSDDGYPCLISETELQAIIDDAVGPGQVAVPPYDLGSGPTAVLDHAIPPQLWQGFCDALQGGELPGPIEFPRCDLGFDVAILLDVVLDGVPLTGKREVRLLYDDATPANATPVATAAVAIDPDSGDRIDVLAGTAQLRRGVTYDLEVDVAEDQAETFEQVPIEGGPPQTVFEDLRLSWFHEGGELDRSATSFLDGTTTFDDLRANEWDTPTESQRRQGTARLFFVLRDDRGGTSWLEATVELVQ